MRRSIEMIFSRKSNILSGLIAIFIVSLIALGCTCNKKFDFSNSSANSSSGPSDNPFSNSSSTSDSTDSEMPDEALLTALVNETTSDFALAISTEDFSDLYEKASSDFRKTYTLDQTKDAFKTFITNKRVVSPVLAKAVDLEPEFSPDPSIRHEQGLSILVTTGKYDTKPIPTRFEYEYVKRDGEWKMLKLVIKLVK